MQIDFLIWANISTSCTSLHQGIVQLLFPLTSSTESFMRNSKHFIETMTEERISSDEVLVSFDVSSLFTNVPMHPRGSGCDMQATPGH